MTNYDANDMEAMLHRLGFDQESAQDIIEVQGINNLDFLLALAPEGIDKLCKNVRKPGGKVHGEGEEDASTSATGNAISTMAEHYLTWSVFYLKHAERCSRKPHPDEITIESVTALMKQSKAEVNHKDMALPPAKEILSPNKPWPKIFESFDSILRNSRGTTGIPLLYCVRKDEAVADDPPEGWRSYDDEMIGRAPIKVNGSFDPQFLIDNAKVWRIISTLTESHACFTQAKTKNASKTLDGRQAYWNLYEHYCGPNIQANQVATAELTLQKLEYHGEKKRGNFETYVNAHVEQHNILNSLEGLGYRGIDGWTKVQHLYNGIKCPRVQSIKDTIFAIPTYRRDFDACVTLYKDRIASNGSDQTQPLQVASLLSNGSAKYRGQGSRHAGRGGGGGRGNSGRNSNQAGRNNNLRRIDENDVVDRYYTPEEYERFTPQAKVKLHKIRQSNKKRKRGGNYSNTSAVGSSARDDDNSSNNQSTATPPASNRTNPALTRQRNRRN